MAFETYVILRSPRSGRLEGRTQSRFMPRLGSGKSWHTPISRDPRTPRGQASPIGSIIAVAIASSGTLPPHITSWKAG